MPQHVNRSRYWRRAVKITRLLLCVGGRQFIGVDGTGARDGDIARLQYPFMQLETNSCLHVDYQLVGQVQLEVGYQLDRQSDMGHLLCTLVPNSTHVGWFSADILLPAGQYQMYFNAIFLSPYGRPLVSLDSIKLLNVNCTRIIYTGKSSCFSSIKA